MNTSQKFGKKVKIERIMRDWTIMQLAEYADLGTTTISEIERGSVSPTLDSVGKLAKAFKIKLHELLIFDEIEKFNNK